MENERSVAANNELTALREIEAMGYTGEDAALVARLEQQGLIRANGAALDLTDAGFRVLFAVTGKAR